MGMEINVNDINLNELKLGGFGHSVIELMVIPSCKEGKEVTDEIYSWIVNPPAVYMSAANKSDDKAKKAQKVYLNRRNESLTLVQLMKKEFYEFLCTESKYYKKERLQIGSNINVVISGLAVAVATKLKGLEIGIATSFITSFMIVLGKMGKKAMCERYKPSS